jgi:hypothetical protein
VAKSKAKIIEMKKEKPVVEEPKLKNRKVPEAPQKEFLNQVQEFGALIEKVQ